VSRRLGNAEWRALSDAANEPDFPGDSLGELFASLPAETQQLCAREGITTEQILERITQPGAELCPRCGARPVRVPHLGVCRACASRLSVEAAHEIAAEITAHREHDTSKQQLHRLREEMGDALPVHLRAMKRHTCEECGRVFQSRAQRAQCPECEDASHQRARDPTE
jgi:hypothetical protein